MCKFLIGLGADVNARAHGSFFGVDGPAYYGEYPISYASSLGYKDIAMLLQRHGAEVNARDAQGNGPLHMAVLHNQVSSWPAPGVRRARSETGPSDAARDVRLPRGRAGRHRTAPEPEGMYAADVRRLPGQPADARAHLLQEGPPHPQVWEVRSSLLPVCAVQCIRGGWDRLVLGSRALAPFWGPRKL